MEAFYMKRSICSLLSVAMMLSAVTGCSQTVSETEADEISEVESAVETASGDRIIPFLGGYTPDEWTPEYNEYLYGFVDLDGNVIYEPVFDSYTYSDDADAYIVKGDENGVIKYGILTADGEHFTGLIYDGAWKTTGEDDLCFFVSTVDGDEITVTSIDSNLEMLDVNTITLDPDALPFDIETSEICVQYLREGRAVITDNSVFYNMRYVVDTTTGEVIYTEPGFADAKIFGDFIIEQDVSGQGIVVYDMDGNVLIDDIEAYSGQINDDSYMVLEDGDLNIYDTSWHIKTSMFVGENAVAMTSFGNIAVCVNGSTKLYDQNLQYICDVDDVDLNAGQYLRDFHGFGQGDMFFNALYPTDEIINMNTGARMAEEDGFFSSFEGGYIISDNVSNGNDPVKRWRVYDGNFNLLLADNGMADIVTDQITNDVYVVSLDGDTMTVYSLPDGEVLFETTDYSSNYLYAYDGMFYGSDTNTTFLLNSNGEAVFEYEVGNA